MIEFPIWGDYMRKPVLFMLAMVFLFACSNENEQGTKIDEPKTTTVQAESSDEEKKEIDFLGEDKFDIVGNINPVVIGKWIDEGYNIYTLDDGEQLEDLIKESISAHEEEHKKLEAEYGMEILETEIFTHESKIKVFAKNILRDYPDKEKYIDKLYEANELIKDKDEDAVNKKIEEAEELRKQ